MGSFLLNGTSFQCLTSTESTMALLCNCWLIIALIKERDVLQKVVKVLLRKTDKIWKNKRHFGYRNDVFLDDLKVFFQIRLKIWCIGTKG